KYWQVSLVDTERLMEQEQRSREGALAEEITATEDYVKAFVNFLLGNVMKCDSVEELRQCKIGVTADCLLYQNFQLRRLNPDNYTKRAYIGEKSKRQRQKELAARLEKLNAEREAYVSSEEEAKKILALEFLKDTVEEYQNLFTDISEKQEKEKQKKKIQKKMDEIGSGVVETLKKEREAVHEKQKVLEEKIDDIKRQIWKKEDAIQKDNDSFLEKNEQLLSMQRELRGSFENEEAFTAYMGNYKNPRYEKLIAETMSEIGEAEKKCEQQKNGLVDLRSEYLRNHPKRDFSASTEHNDDYDKLLEELQCEELEDFRKKANEQAKSAVEHFKEDFIYKIRSAIKEAYVRRDELNRVIRNLNFGKDRYQFRITRNKGRDGEFYDMFMDEELDIDPSTLAASMEHQMNLFTMEHENKYGTLMSDLIHIFIPPENATPVELEDAKRNMEKYADYRTYLSFEMEQIVEGDERLVIGLSKMIKKNSGGEGQNPLYIALLASFAQAYHINLSSRLTRRPTIRLVVLDEAFSKMDAEKVASCIDLIRSLGFQAIISATNDKIQNYIENVDKTFVYANPNKKSISIQEFEKRDFSQLVMEE
ncbi:MAG: SbcC/MukB-like Walker B domain-containing protein, partial [Clostridiales bacterium]|nr:SbcC/MukB-like Walker B domain-containing protein [Clostridiales bacterium]